MNGAVLITGAGGMLAHALLAALEHAGINAVARSHGQLDVTNTERLQMEVHAARPALVVHCAAYTRVDDAESNEAQAFAVNAEATGHLARVCAEIGCGLLYPSTDYVFNGESQVPYAVDVAPDPLNAYGRSKLAGEEAARSAPRHWIVRTGWLYGPGGRNFVRTVKRRLEEGAHLRVVDDQVGTPTYTPDLAHALVGLIRTAAPPGTYHVSNSGTASWYDLAGAIARASGGSGSIERCTSDDYRAAARRPRYSVLDTSGTDALIGPLRDWQAALAEALATGAY